MLHEDVVRGLGQVFALGDVVGRMEELFSEPVFSLRCGRQRLKLQRVPCAWAALTPGDLVSHGGLIVLDEGELKEKGMEVVGVVADLYGLEGGGFCVGEAVVVQVGLGENGVVDSAGRIEPECLLGCGDGWRLLAELCVCLGNVEPRSPVTRIGFSPELICLDALLEIFLSVGIVMCAYVKLLFFR